MSKQLVTENMRDHWKPLVENNDVGAVRSLSKEDIQIRLLENQALYNQGELGIRGDQASQLAEADTAVGNVQAAAGRWAPVLISMAKRLAPINIANEFFGTQPMSGPDGQIFALRARKGASPGGANPQDNPELFINEADSAFSGDTGTAAAGDPSGFTLQEVTGDAADDNTATVAGRAMSTQVAETLGSTGNWSRVGITIQKATVTAKSRGLYADYSHELRQDMMAIHGEDVDSILADVMVTEMAAEQNREMIRHMNVSAKKASKIATNGIFDLQADASGRWDLERWKYLLFVLEVEANAIAIDTRRGKANKLLCSPNVASALVMAGMLDYSPALSANRSLQVDPSNQTFAGVLANGMQVFIDPYAGIIEYATLAYKGANELDAGYFFCPYVPVEMYRANGSDSFQPRMAFKSRYGICSNPFVQIPVDQNPQTAVTSDGITANSNPYFRKMAIRGLL